MEPILEPLEKTKTVPVTYRLPVDLVQYLRMVAKRTNRPQVEVLLTFVSLGRRHYEAELGEQRRGAK